MCGCGHYESGLFNAYGRVADENFDFIFIFNHARARLSVQVFRLRGNAGLRSLV